MKMEEYKKLLLSNLTSKENNYIRPIRIIEGILEEGFYVSLHSRNTIIKLINLFIYLDIFEENDPWIIKAKEECNNLTHSIPREQLLKNCKSCIFNMNKYFTRCIDFQHL